MEVRIIGLQPIYMSMNDDGTDRAPAEFILDIFS